MPRELSFSKKWAKLHYSEFTTFRVSRKDRDWARGEVVRVVYHARCKDRAVYGNARIIEKTSMLALQITNEEAIKDGFPGGKEEMELFMVKSHKDFDVNIILNKLTLRWLPRESDAKKETAILVSQTPEPGGAHPVPVQDLPALTRNPSPSGPVPGSVADSTS
jgi:hypothetical protein